MLPVGNQQVGDYGHHFPMWEVGSRNQSGTFLGQAWRDYLATCDFQSIVRAHADSADPLAVGTRVASERVLVTRQTANRIAFRLRFSSSCGFFPGVLQCSIC
jgi:hypothetical protein